MEQTKLVPKRRFKEFQNAHAWEQRKLGEVIEGLYNGQTPSRFRDDFWNGSINWLSSGDLNRSIVKTASEKITEAGRASANLRVVPKNTFVMAITGLEAAGTRGNCGILGIDTTLNQSCMAVYPNKNLLSTQFLFQWYRMVGEEYGTRFTQGTKQQSYNAEIIKDLDICLPKKEEQVKISQLLSELDNLITLHQRKLEKTKALKSAYLSEMFPAEGERVPKRRFAGFTQPWEQRKLSDITDSIGTGKSSFIKHEKSADNPYAILGSTSIIGYDSEFDHEGDFILTARVGANAGNLYRYYGKAKITDNTVFIKGKNLSFLYPLLDHFDLRKLSFGTGQPLVKASELKNLQIKTPSYEEQIQVGNFFNQLDYLVTLHQRKLEKLQNLKKAYLNEMFV
ncbi:restriction endonuclease subunit S [Heyndrickxia coagulans]|uniref:Type I restriction enzyme, S subunit n=1 Tax=Heyndrickxia coagulans DSM 1 = ATCC 7050 TaxID=1121088 RepID=A0A8B4BWK6_HEYCO|nr:restriction endonuclease subunit S [Heyndrickxia coagulans]AJH80032.1 type I restriction modification DNA specificity domain protein [Heyndrickxia coagulans DSM 1 = ATCC 7050]MCR2847299.1 restriction endonuclease subunit S [Heyndrickxia coagulans]MDR4225322.1 restriction endonuclease subunit S [Heyndrickxia coagulans DSM 1 = ATCC 7050]MED4494477.1 restriction endonuclease subunit S [Heyndrickxia coagulans]MED4535286.1 restriction endonuclease subunit S [Heyndrickxia coagulans]